MSIRSALSSTLSSALVCLAALSFGCAQDMGSVAAENSHAIYGGHDVSVSSDLWRSSVAIRGDRTTCSGVLVSKEVILTAAHCMWAFRKSDGLTISFFKGSDSVLDVELARGEYDLVAHPEFDDDGPVSTESFHDMGLVVVSWSLVPKTHRVPKIFSGKLKVGDSLVTVGNGLTESGYGNGSGEELRYVSSKLQSLTSKDGGKSARAFGKSGKKDGTCGGDSGGAVYVRTPSRGMELIGVHVSADDTISSEIGCGSKMGIAILTPTMRKWIDFYL